MTDQVADRDITRRNHLGQTVVVVPKGQRIPAHLAEAEGRAIHAPAEDKAVAAPSRKKTPRVKPAPAGE